MFRRGGKSVAPAANLSTVSRSPNLLPSYYTDHALSCSALYIYRIRQKNVYTYYRKKTLRCIIDYCKSTIYFCQYNNICIYFNITYIVILATCFDSYESSSGINIQELLVHIILQFFFRPRQTIAIGTKKL